MNEPSRFSPYSPNVQTVLNAYRDGVWVDGKYTHVAGIAALLRSLLQVCYTDEREGDDGVWYYEALDVDDLMAIITELETKPTNTQTANDTPAS